MLRRIACIVVLYSSLAHADVNLCSGVWMDRPCEGGKVSSPEIEKDPLQSEKEKIVTNLNRFAAKVQAELGHTDFEADGARDFCMKFEVTVEECRARALRADKSLMASLQMFSRIRQRSLELTQRQQEIELRRERQLRDLKKSKSVRRH